MRRLLRLLPHRGQDGVPEQTHPDAPTPEARYRAERRAVARRLHPDLGGDVDEYLAALAEVDARHGRTDGTTAVEDVTSRRSWRARPAGLRRSVNRAARATRQRLPRRVPGARRYARL